MLLALPLPKTECSAQTDSLYNEIDSTIFISGKHTSSIRNTLGGMTEINLSRIQGMPQILGNTDPIRFVRNLPAVQTTSEYDSGIHVQGCDNAHNDISLAGVPVYGVSHLFGLFSIFNPAHYGKMTFSSTSYANRLGGTLNMGLPDTLSRNVSGDLTVGMMSSQGTLGIRTGDRSHLRLSARQSYLNLLYGRWLKIDQSPTKYGFGDYNLSWLITPTGQDRIYLEGYFGQDKASISVNAFDVGLAMQWRNYSGAVHWEHDADRSRSRQTLFFSGYDSRCHVTQDISHISLDSYIRTIGYKGKTQWEKTTAGIDVTYFNVLPQNPLTEGLYDVESPAQKQQNALEASIYGDYCTYLTDRLALRSHIRGNAYLSPEHKMFWSLSPDLSLTFNGYRFGKVTASYGWRHQYLFQSGMSNIGLPIEFWFMAGEYSAPQYSQGADISYDVKLLKETLSFSASVYYKRLYNQAEYKGDLFDFFGSVYHLEDHLLKGDGWNYGLNLMLHKQSGDLTGWISYSLGRALRRFDNNDYTGIYPANHERIQELNAVCSYLLGRWNLSGNFIYASGVPFTAPAYFYISSGQIITKPGEHNACRMRPYIRLDLSATYAFSGKNNRENEINISVYNATGRWNDVMYRLKQSDGVYSYGPVSFFLRWMPSISYRYKF